MQRKIKLNKDEVIVFMGSMNAMPMMYALELKKLGYEVIYFVDVPKKDTLSRPECHFPDIDYPYPSWIVEFILPSQLLLPLSPKLFVALYQGKIERLTEKDVGCFVLNGFFASLAPYLPESSKKIGLSHGSDLDVWGNTEDVEQLVKNFKNKSIFKYLLTSISKILIKYIVNMQYLGFARSDSVIYFPTGFSKVGDKVLRELIKQGVRCVPRYDISFEPLKGQSRNFKYPSKTLKIFSGVRFLFRTFPEGDNGSNKGNDLIIGGIAKYFSRNRNIQVHFVEKGEDVQYAKVLCKKHGLEDAVVWHKEMPFKELLELYHEADICFDQLGDHWIAGIGGYALWLGKPLIANDDSAVRSKVWPIDNPVCSARTSEEVYEWLIKLENVELRKELSKRSQEFAECYMSPLSVLNCLFDIEPQPQSVSQIN